MICYDGNLPAADTINKILKELTKNQNDMYICHIEENIINDKIRNVFINIELDEDSCALSSSTSDLTWRNNE